MRKTTAFLTAIIMSAAIAATPVSALAASNSSQQVHAGYEASDMANDESDVNEEIIPEEATPEADTQEVVIPEESATAANVTSWTDLQEAINQAAKGDMITLAAAQESAAALAL